jgi:hypothetical protein
MFPNVIEQKGRRFFSRRSIEHYKATLAGIPFQDHLGAGPDVLVPIRAFATQMGVCVRTIGRRIEETRDRVSLIKQQIATTSDT